MDWQGITGSMTILGVILMAATLVVTISLPKRQIYKEISFKTISNTVILSGFNLDFKEEVKSKGIRGKTE